ncbi:hypothetical protein [Streptococcus suis]|uniref:hypothetical protein n=1 Tax=Streptococcus suis TaxID=1307 RepID=UPI000CF57056|nr:hypothetical protein [Streptococcus suis]HEL1613176.1 hypothetical protein [Streptococcus suis]
MIVGTGNSQVLTVNLQLESSLRLFFVLIGIGAAKVGGLIGTAIGGPVGTAVGAVGGFVIGVVGSMIFDGIYDGVIKPFVEDTKKYEKN